jgi:hypothetical protein
MIEPQDHKIMDIEKMNMVIKLHKRRKEKDHGGSRQRYT